MTFVGKSKNTDIVVLYVTKLNSFYCYMPTAYSLL